MSQIDFHTYTEVMDHIYRVDKEGNFDDDQVRQKLIELGIPQQSELLEGMVNEYGIECEIRRIAVEKNENSDDLLSHIRTRLFSVG